MKSRSLRTTLLALVVTLLLCCMVATCSDKDPVQPTNNPPGAPSSPSPPTGSAARPLSQQLGWDCSDPDGDPVKYDVYFGTDPTPIDKVGSDLSSRSYDPGTLAFSTTYYWKVVAKDNHAHSTSGPVWSFTTGSNGPPTQPSSPTPTSGSTGQSITTDVSWSASTDPETDPVVYDVYFGTTSPPSLAASNHAQTTYDPGTLLYDQIYYWRIVAKDDHLNETPGSIWNFTTVSNQAPSQPSNPSPADDATGQALSVSVSWAASTDPEGDPLTYDVFFGTTSPPPFVSTQSGTSYNPPGDLDLTRKYYWQVWAKDNHANTNPSPIWEFTTRAGTWNTMTSNTTKRLNDVWGLSGTDVFAVGGFNGGIITRYNGSTWNEFGDAIIDEWEGYCVWGTSGSNVFAGGSGRSMTTPVGHIFQFNGATWSVVVSQPNWLAIVTDFWPRTSSDIFAVGIFGANFRYNGTSWTNFIITDTEDFGGNGVWGTSANNVYAVGAVAFVGTGRIYRWNGSGWTMVHTRTSPFRDVWGTSSNDIWVVGDGGQIEHYNGSSWSSAYSPTGNHILCIWGTGANDIFAVGVGGVILHNNGSGWTTMTSPTVENLNGVWGSSSENVFAVGDNGTILHYNP